MLFRFIIILATSVTLSSCVAPLISLNHASYLKLSTIDQYLIVTQNELDVSVARPEIPYVQVGEFLASAINVFKYPGVVEKSAPVVSGVQGFNFRTVMLNAMQAELVKAKDMKYQIKTQIESDDSSKQLRMSESVSSAVLFSNVKYSLVSGNLVVTARSEMYSKLKFVDLSKNNQVQDGTEVGDVIYRNIFSFRKQSVTVENIRSSLRESATSIAKQLIQDINQPL